MNINNFKEIDKEINNNKIGNIVSNFLKEVSNALKNENKLIGIEEGDINIIYGMHDAKITLLNPKTGKEQEIYVATSETNKKEWQEKGIKDDNIYKTDKDTFYKWNFGTKLIYENGKLNIYNGEIDIKNDDAWYKLDDLYASMKADENKEFIVKEVTNDKVIFNYKDGGGFISRPKELYPNFKVGDTVKKVNDRFVII